MSEEQLIEAIAVTHVELILILPFREGNGRLSRLLADVMAVQGGYMPLDYQSWEQNKAEYISGYVNGLRPNVLLGWCCVETRLNSKAKMGELFARRFKRCFDLLRGLPRLNGG